MQCKVSLISISSVNSASVWLHCSKTGRSYRVCAYRSQTSEMNTACAACCMLQCLGSPTTV